MLDNLMKKKKFKYKGGLLRNKQKEELITFILRMQSPKKVHKRVFTTKKDDDEFILEAIQLENLFKSNIYFCA